MIFTKSLNYEDIKKQLSKDDVISVIGCSSCARVAGTGTSEQIAKLAKALKSDGYNIVDGYWINTVCTPKVYQAKLNKEVNTVITMSCSAGFANVKHIYPDLKVVTSCDDVGLMEANTKQGTIKIAMAYDGYEDKKGSVFEMYTGNEINEGVK